MTTKYQIPITYVVSASVITPGAGLEPLKLSTILLLTDEQPITEQPQAYTIARTASAVANTYGTDAEVTALAQTIFSQQPNILANDGYVIAAPMLASVTPAPTPATAGTLTTGDINVANFASVTNGVLNLTVDGTATEITELDFTGVADLIELVNVLQAKLTTVNISVNNNAQIVFTSKTTGASSSVVIKAKTAKTGTDLYGAEYLDGANCTAVAGTAEIVNPARRETLSEAITRLAGQIYFEGILTTRDLNDTEAVAASTAVQSMQNRIFFLPANSTTALNTGGLFEQVQSNYNTKCLLYTLGDDETTTKQNARKFAAAYASRGLAVNYNGSNTTLTMNLKDLVGISADTNISETILDKCASLGVDCFPSIEGLAKVISNKQGGQYFDQVTNRIWLVNAIQRAVFNTLATTGTKIPQTEPGIAQIINSIREVCNQAVTNGMVAPGTWNSSDTFGNYDDFIRNIEEFGFYIYHQPIAEQAQSEREERKAPVTQVACKEAGAYHSGNILVYIES